MNYVSFDIFDTCLIRKCGEAQNVFFLLGRKLFGVNTTEAEMFYHWRCLAESVAMEKAETKYVSIKDIYAGIPSCIANAYSSVQIMQEELQMEASMLHVVPETKRIIEQERHKGNTIVFISDMYLPSRFLMEQLIRENIAEKDDLCFVSCECGASKSEGNLYAYVEKQMQNKPICHYGDNAWSDIRMARKNGIRAKQIQSGFNRTEKSIIDTFKHNRHFLYYSCLVGIMRYSRIIYKDRTSSEISADFVAPIFTAYVLACLNKAKNESFERLYFLARDGYILLWIAKFFAKKYSGLDLRYLYVSRKSMYLPSLTSLDENEIEKYFGDKLRYTSNKQVLKYFKQTVWDENVVLKEATEARKRIDSYFEKEDIYNENIKYALVDVGWKGSGRYAFNKLLRLRGCTEREMWYWGSFKDWRLKFEGKFWTYNINLNLPLPFITLIEDFFSTSPDLSTIDYKDGKPLFDENSKIDNAQILLKYKNCLACFCLFVNEYELDNLNILDNVSHVCCDVLAERPDMIDLRALSEMNCFSENGNGGRFVHAPRLMDVIRYMLGGHTFHGWIEGNIAYAHKSLFRPLTYIRRVFLWGKNKIK